MSSLPKWKALLAMALPSWTDKKNGSMKRGGLWLITEVGEGNVFTKTQLKEAFPDVAQIDRRVRDLRDFGWRIDTNREDVSLDANEQRFVTQGEPVWEPGKGRAKSNTPITAVQRREIMSKDGHLCRSCGITPGQMYAGDVRGGAARHRTPECPAGERRPERAVRDGVHPVQGRWTRTGS